MDPSPDGMAAERMEADAEALPVPDPKRNIAKLINYVGNGVIMVEILLMVSISVALMLHVRVVVGVVLVLYVVPAFVMIMRLTNDLKKQLEHKYLTPKLVK